MIATVSKKGKTKPVSVVTSGGDMILSLSEFHKDIVNKECNTIIIKKESGEVVFSRSSIEVWADSPKSTSVYKGGVITLQF